MKLFRKKIVDSSKKNNQEELDLDKNLRAFYARVAKVKRHDQNFGRIDDEPLTAEEIKAIDEFWGKYKFAYPEIYYDSFKFFKNRCGKFDVRHCPGAIRERYFKKFFNNSHYHMAHQNKGMYPLLYPGVAKPVTVLRRMAAIYYDENYNPVSVEEATDIIMNKLADGINLIAKPSGLGGGKKITFLNVSDNVSRDEVYSLLRGMGNLALVVQEILEQSPFMKQFNETSINTVRVTTLMWKGKVHPLASLVRIGEPGSKLDNYTQGGSVLGVDINTGICNKWALRHDLKRITKLPSGLVLDQEDLVIPNFDGIVEAVTKMHYLSPYTKLISWDMALDKDNVPTMIENNFAGSLQLHEAVNGPLFGDLMEELLDEYLIKRFCVEFENHEWKFDEYQDYVVVSKYIGSKKNAAVPAEIKGKPIKKIKSSAIPASKALLTLTLPASVAKNSPAKLENVGIIKVVENTKETA